jgi:hypothetical protein
MNAAELHLEDRHEEWVKGYDDGTPADSVTAELRWVLQEGTLPDTLEKRAALTFTAAVGAEQLQVKSGQVGQRQTWRLSVEQRF